MHLKGSGVKTMINIGVLGFIGLHNISKLEENKIALLPNYVTPSSGFACTTFPHYFNNSNLLASSRNSMNKSAVKDQSEEPPALKKGKGIPITGNTSMAMPTLMAT